MMEKKTEIRYKIYFKYPEMPGSNYVDMEYEVNVPNHGTQFTLVGAPVLGSNGFGGITLTKYEDAEVIARALKVVNPKATISIKEEVQERTYV